MNIYIKVEIKNRDLLSRLLLGCYAALKNNDVYIGDDELFEYVQKKKFNPGIIFEKSITPKKAGNLIFHLHHFERKSYNLNH